MNEEDRKKIISNEYADLIVEYGSGSQELVDYQNDTMIPIDDKFQVIYFPFIRATHRIIYESGYSVIPKLFGLVDSTSLEEMGVNKIQSTQFLSLRGQGVLLGFVDTGIEYTNPVFLNADGTTRIISIWDQSIENMEASQDIFYYGTEYNREQINIALQAESALSVVPSKDENGHGSMLAGLAGGSSIEESDFIGVAPLAEFVIVKLKPAKSIVKSFWVVPEEAICYQENDIMFGIQYLVQVARQLKRPIAICIGLGTNQGSHDGYGTLNDMVSRLTNQMGIAIVVAAGNEGNSGHHYYGEINKANNYDTVELKVGENESGFSMELWGNVPGTYSIDILSPTGEYIPRIPARLGENRVIKFIFENTTVVVEYVIVESQTGDELILFRFRKPAPGIWRIKVYGGSDITSGYHIWLPMRNFITPGTFFLRPNPNTTVTVPGDTTLAITVTAYNHKNHSIYLNASRGYSRSNIVKPEIASPGIDVYSPMPGNEFGAQSGTSLAATLTTGVSAMLLEWGIVKGNNKSMDTIIVKKFLIRGAKRSENIDYPNQVWGFGILDIYRTFESLRGES